MLTRNAFYYLAVETLITSYSHCLLPKALHLSTYSLNAPTQHLLKPYYCWAICNVSETSQRPPVMSTQFTALCHN